MANTYKATARAITRRGLSGTVYSQKTVFDVVGEEGIYGTVGTKEDADILAFGLNNNFLESQFGGFAENVIEEIKKAMRGETGVTQMTTIMTTSQNFTTLANLLIASAPTEKARAFAEKVIAQVQAKGSDWIEAHATALEAAADHSNDFCPVRDNRVYFMTRLQLAIAA